MECQLWHVSGTRESDVESRDTCPLCQCKHGYCLLRVSSHNLIRPRIIINKWFYQIQRYGECVNISGLRFHKSGDKCYTNLFVTKILSRLCSGQSELNVGGFSSQSQWIIAFQYIDLNLEKLHFVKKNVKLLLKYFQSHILRSHGWLSVISSRVELVLFLRVLRLLITFSCKDYTLLCPTGSIRPGRRRIMDCFSKLFCNILSYPLSEWVPNTEGEQSTVKWTISIKNSWQKTTCCDFLGDQDVLLWRFPATQLLLHRTVLNFKNITLFRILFI